MPFAHEQRAEWRKKLQSGVMPDEVRQKVELYRKMREDSTWRSSTMVECLGEAALVLLEQFDGESSSG